MQQIAVLLGMEAMQYELPISEQYELFEPGAFSRTEKRLVDYWRKSLEDWPRQVFQFRHYLGCTGWSMATQGLCFAEWLHAEGWLSDSELGRYQAFDKRIQAWEEARA
jgi:hypothetical protein